MSVPSAHHRQRVVVVGSGFAGFETARGVSRRLRRAEHPAEVVLVSPNDYMLYTPLLPDVAGGLIDPRYVAVPLANELPDVSLRPGCVDRVDLATRTLHVSDCAPGDREMSWDRLVLTPGSVTKLMGVPGVAEHARGLKTVAEALYLREHFLHQLQLAEYEADPRDRRARRTVVVVGASYAGTELIAQLHALAEDHARQRGQGPAQARFVLLDLADRVMPEVGEKLSDLALESLRERGIEVRLGTSLEELSAQEATLTDGDVIGTRTVAWVTGVTGAPMLETLGLPLENGRLVVDSHLAVPGHPDVFAAGDAAAVPDLASTHTQQITPPTAQHAVRQGKAAARNVAASLGVGSRRRYKHHDLGLVVDLGPGYAVANPLGLKLSGWPAKVAARGYHLGALPRAANRWSIALAWAAEATSDRPLSRLGLVSAQESDFRASEGIGD
ncbi:NAD(P)/FAD-dependent oxidoreductase [Janibacter sp. GS2]|uniref:NAD(P)/FAD-dependent oxidoreductase n=1 Tax=Janibacter sp. GS2 TaxID=3442646 RepID=UPI003EC05EA4